MSLFLSLPAPLALGGAAPQPAGGGGPVLRVGLALLRQVFHGLGGLHVRGPGPTLFHHLLELARVLQHGAGAEHVLVKGLAVVIGQEHAVGIGLAQLLAEKELEEITVKEVADTADINRKTFYNYYAGVHQVIDEIENEIISTFDQAIREVDARRDIKNPYTFFEKITAILNQDLDFYSHLFRMRGNLSLSYKITTLLKTKILKSFLQEHSCDPQEAEIFVEYAVWGMMAVYESWFNSQRSTPLEEISQKLSVVCVYGLAGLLREDS